MPRWRPLIVAAIGLAALLMIPSLVESQTGHLEVRGTPGVSVSIDGVGKGVISPRGALYLTDLPVGQVKLSASMAGYSTYEATLNILANQVLQHSVRLRATRVEAPAVRTRQEGRRTGGSLEEVVEEVQTGTLVVQTLPIEASVELPGLGVREEKERDKWTAEEVPVGQWTFTVSTNELADSLVTASGSFRVRPNGTTHVFANLITREVTVRSLRYTLEDEDAAETAIYRGGSMSSRGAGRYGDGYNEEYHLNHDIYRRIVEAFREGWKPRYGSTVTVVSKWYDYRLIRWSDGATGEVRYKVALSGELRDGRD